VATPPSAPSAPRNGEVEAIAREKARLLQSAPGGADCNKDEPELDPFGDADEEINTWIAAFAAWPRKKKKLAYSTFLRLTAIGDILK
jgi:hypothetical protein